MQADPEIAMERVRGCLQYHYEALKAMPLNEMLEARYRKFRSIAPFYTTA